MRPVFADLVAEIQRSIGFYASVHRDSRITKVLALGGTFRLPGLQKYLQQNLQLDVQRIDRLGNTPPADAKVAAALNENILSSVSAYGLALQAMGEAKITSSLLPEEIRRERMWRDKTKWFAAAAACFVAAAAIPIGKYYYLHGQYVTAKPVRDDIERTLKQGTKLSNDWKGVEQKGEPDRKQIADVKSTTQYRDLWPSCTPSCGSAVPTVPAPAAGRRRRTSA